MFALPLHITPRLERYATWLGRNTLNPAALAASSSSARWYSCSSIWKLLISKRIERDLCEQLSIQEVLSSPSAPGWTCGSRVLPFWYWWILCYFFGQISCYVIPISLWSKTKPEMLIFLARFFWFICGGYVWSLGPWSILCSCFLGCLLQVQSH